MGKKFSKLREKYTTFRYKDYQVVEEEDKYTFEYFFEICGLRTFNPKMEIYKNNFVNDDRQTINLFAFNLGLVELISYWKSACPQDLIVECGYLSDEQRAFWKKTYFNGLGEFFYRNKIETTIDDFMHIHDRCMVKLKCEKLENLSGNLIPIGGGKDSVVTLELLSSEKNKNTAIIINPKDANLKCAQIAGVDTVIVKRILDPKLFGLNEKGFLNGHTPFSVVVAFISYIVAYLQNKEYIVLSNEASANEATIIGTNINHQYSKTIEFENDFREYTKTNFNPGIKYFSLLRCFNELEIAKMFSKNEKYFPAFKSCNVGSKSVPWVWCCACPKCLFVYIMLSAFIKKDELIKIFGEDLFENEKFKVTLLELLGQRKTKPFECIGMIEEINYAINKTIKNYEGPLPVLLDYYNRIIHLEVDESVSTYFNEEHNIEEKFLEIMKRSEIYDK